MPGILKWGFAHWFLFSVRIDGPSGSTFGSQLVCPPYFRQGDRGSREYYKEFVEEPGSVEF